MKILLCFEEVVSSEVSMKLRPEVNEDMLLLD